MMPLSAAWLAAATLVPSPQPPAPPPEPPQGKVQVVAIATAEVLPVARGTIEPGPQEPRRQARRDADGRIMVEFE